MPSVAQFGGYLDSHPGAEAMRNKSIFVTILPKEKNFFSVCPIISVQEGDFLGVFAGVIRYSGLCNVTYGVPGPEKKSLVGLFHSHRGSQSDESIVPW